jgi:hypothetical protein
VMTLWTLLWNSLNDLNKISLCGTYKISSYLMKIFILLLSLLLVAQSSKILAILDNKALVNSHSEFFKLLSNNN